MSPVQRVLVIGELGRQYAMAHRQDAPLLAIPLQADDGGGQRAVEFLRPADTAAVEVLALPTLTRIASGLAQTWAGTAMAAALRALLPGGDTARLGPLMLLRLHDGGQRDGGQRDGGQRDGVQRDGGQRLVELMMCSRLRAAGALFTRAARFTADPSASLDVLMGQAWRLAKSLQDNILSENEVCTHFESGTEIETKIALGGDTSPWSLATLLSEAVGGAELPGLIPDVGNEMQRWQTRQHSYEVLAPAAEAGYVAFIASAAGRYSFKQKRFATEGLRRPESFRLDLPIDEGHFDRYLEKEFPHLETRRLPSHTRAKFDVNVESAGTGHFFGIEIDEVTVVGSGEVMRQVEIEYHRSWIHDGLSPDTIEPELERITGLILAFLHRRGVAAQRTYYSKLSFLRDTLDPPSATGRIAIMDVDPTTAAAARGLDRPLVYVIMPGTPLEHLSARHTNIYSVDFTSPGFPGFVDRVLRPLAPQAIVAGSIRSARAAALASAQLGLRPPDTATMAIVNGAAS